MLLLEAKTKILKSGSFLIYMWLFLIYVFAGKAHHHRILWEERQWELQDVRKGLCFFRNLVLKTIWLLIILLLFIYYRLQKILEMTALSVLDLGKLSFSESFPLHFTRQHHSVLHCTYTTFHCIALHCVTLCSSFNHLMLSAYRDASAQERKTGDNIVYRPENVS